MLGGLGEDSVKAAITGAASIAAGAEQAIEQTASTAETVLTANVDSLKQMFLQAVGEALAAATAERTEALKQLDDMVHGWLDRCANFGILPRKP